ncbi:hypothetical protein TBLA_0D01540 [Henningerozyma blattae CBS 6284]|uniref:GPI transamidase component GPI17 n=1 Tax=Henningerozyma blattae (strain ATCC 34711 / CBS 6284 / DSM 70876 / NBRC 10599 / NRRL Y-10934 / UCD 77-7) TaxID=1071380 RepID=I2H2R0_HENB6|nr:hypothetical protein TBLA_0D01540 [Tetrapisispora blattae CBS 6284]CCH60662.1 hypothetical protein TBLA_0D01540 [Tetrapisispora blattae CBS 6284]
MSSTYSIRKLTAIACVALYLFVGFPLWYKLTTIYRADLPYETIDTLHSNIFKDFKMAIPVYINSAGIRSENLIDGIQTQINTELNEFGINWNIQLNDLTNDKLNPMEDYVIDFKIDDSIESSTIVTNFNSTFSTILLNSNFDIKQNFKNLSDLILHNLFELEYQHFQSISTLNNNDAISITYNPNVHLSLSLLSGDGYPIVWEIDKALRKTFNPLRKLLSPLVNFTIDTDIIYYNDLNLHSLNQLNNIKTDNKTNNPKIDISHTIDLSELSYMNYFNEPIALNLVILFPSILTSPDGLLFINNSTQTLESTQVNKELTKHYGNWESFLVPQWGVLIINKYALSEYSYLNEEFLAPIINDFTKDLFKLLGYMNPNENDLDSPILTINSFKRIHLLQNLFKAIETLKSLTKLTKQFEQMSIPKNVLNDVKQTLNIRDEIISALKINAENNDTINWEGLLSQSNQMIKLSESAFFNGEMVQQNFFPQEHKIAVYLPMLGPLTMMIFTSLFKIFKEKPIDENIMKEIKEDDEKFNQREKIEITDSNIDQQESVILSIKEDNDDIQLNEKKAHLDDDEQNIENVNMKDDD